METKSEIGNPIDELIAKYLSGEANEQERQEIEAWAGQSGENLAVLDESRRTFERAGLWLGQRRYDASAAWSDLQQRLDGSSNVVTLKPATGQGLFVSRILKIAASLLIAISLGLAGYYLGFRNHQPAVYTEVMSGQRQVLDQVILPDGTLVTLNSGSKLTYPREFSGTSREVSISGEAFFDVVPDPSRPFIIAAGNANIRVLGTSFNVLAYPGDTLVEVVVETGKVQVTASGIDEQVAENLLLDPGEKGTYLQRNGSLYKGMNNDPNFSAWRTHQFEFNETPLMEVARLLEKVYFVEVSFSDPSIGDLQLTASFDQQPVEFILDVIRLTFQLELTQSNGHYFLTQRANH